MRTVILSFFLEASRLKRAYENLRYTPTDMDHSGATLLLGTSAYVQALEWDEENKCPKLREVAEDKRELYNEKLQNMLNATGRGFYTMEDLLLVTKAENAALESISTEGLEPGTPEGLALGAKMLHVGVMGCLQGLRDIFASKGVAIDEDIDIPELSVEDTERIREEQEKNSPMGMMRAMMTEKFGGRVEVLHVGENSMGVAINLGGSEDEEEPGAEGVNASTSEPADASAVNSEANENIS